MDYQSLASFISLGLVIFGMFKTLRGDIKENRKEMNILRSEIRGDIKDLRTEVHGLSERVNRMDGQLYQVTQMIYLRHPIQEKHLDEDMSLS